MNKHLLKKWAILLLSCGMLLSSCINKDYDFDNFDDEMALKDFTLGIPLGFINYSITDLLRQANFKDSIACEVDTIFLIYNQKLNFTADQGQENIETQTINLFNDIVEEGSVLYFSNPIFNSVIFNHEENNQALVKINSITAGKDGFPDKIAIFENGLTTYEIHIPGNNSTKTRFDRVNGGTNQLFRIGEIPNIGPDAVNYNFSLINGKKSR